VLSQKCDGFFNNEIDDSKIKMDNLTLLEKRFYELFKIMNLIIDKLNLEKQQMTL
jgi:hypothetical protein